MRRLYVMIIFSEDCRFRWGQRLVPEKQWTCLEIISWGLKKAHAVLISILWLNLIGFYIFKQSVDFILIYFLSRFWSGLWLIAEKIFLASPNRSYLYQVTMIPILLKHTVHVISLLIIFHEQKVISRRQHLICLCVMNVFRRSPENVRLGNLRHCRCPRVFEKGVAAVHLI